MTGRNNFFLKPSADSFLSADNLGENDFRVCFEITNEGDLKLLSADSSYMKIGGIGTIHFGRYISEIYDGVSIRRIRRICSYCISERSVCRYISHNADCSGFCLVTAAADCEKLVFDVRVPSDSQIRDFVGRMRNFCGINGIMTAVVNYGSVSVPYFEYADPALCFMMIQKNLSADLLWKSADTMNIDQKCGLTVRAFPFEDNKRAALVVSDKKHPIAVFSGSGEFLTDREYKIMLLAARGLTDRSIAHTLKLSESLVKKIICSGYAKLRVGSRLEMKRLMPFRITDG